MGVRYGISQNTFEVNCFGQQGTCQVQSLAGNSELMPGQKIDFQGEIAGQVEVADCKAWQSLYRTDCVMPSSTPTITAMETSKETPTPVPTNTATMTPTNTVQNLNNGGREDGRRGEGGGSGSGGSGSGGGG